MKYFKFFWKAHKWVGIVLSVVFINLAVTGILLLVKKKFEWIQPPTQQGAEGTLEDFITVEQLFDIVLSQGHPDFQSLDDIDRVDFRPDKRVHKVLSLHHHSEIQIDAVTGAVLNQDQRVSDLLEDLHDGSFWGEWAHTYLMPLTGLGLLFMSATGLYLWLNIYTRKKRRLRKT
ncbi:PepSY domain-containing protein [Planctomycetota bacterium]